MKSLLPIIFVILALTGAILFALTKNNIPGLVSKQESVTANQLDLKTPSPTATPTLKDLNPAVSIAPVAKTTITPTPSMAIVPTLTEKKVDAEETTTKGGEKIVAKKEKVVTKTTKTTVCTPVYGMSNTCTEHVVVDTAGETAALFNLAGLSYLLGLGAFIKSKNA